MSEKKTDEHKAKQSHKDNEKRKQNIVSAKFHY